VNSAVSVIVQVFSFSNTMFVNIYILLFEQKHPQFARLPCLLEGCNYRYIDATPVAHRALPIR